LAPPVLDRWLASFGDEDATDVEEEKRVSRSAALYRAIPCPLAELPYFLIDSMALSSTGRGFAQ
jgi:hypothetical protein